MPKVMVRPKMNKNAKPFCIALSENVFDGLPEDADGNVSDAAKKQAIIDHLALTSPRLVVTDDPVAEDAPLNAAKIKPSTQAGGGSTPAAQPGSATPGPQAGPAATPGK